MPLQTKIIKALHAADEALSAEDSEHGLRAFLELALDLFQCDRAYLQVPCDPDAPSYEVPFQAARPGWETPRDVMIPISPMQRALLRARAESKTPMVLDVQTLQSAEYQDLREAGVAPAKEFGVRALMAVCVHPPIGPKWSLGIHHCSDEHVFTSEEVELFTLLARRAGAALSLWLVDERISKVTGREAVGLMVGSLAIDLSVLLERITMGIENLDTDSAAQLREDTELARRLVTRVVHLSKP